jgi:hypothetical protein
MYKLYSVHTVYMYSECFTQVQTCYDPIAADSVHICRPIAIKKRNADGQKLILIMQTYLEFKFYLTKRNTLNIWS